MRIISDFHDYYDCVQAQGQDLSVVWMRKPKEISIIKKERARWTFTETFPFPTCGATTLHHWHRDYFWCYQTTIGFCGKIYPLLELNILGHEESTICYNLEEVDSFMESNFKEKQLKAYRQTKGFSKQWSSCYRRTSFSKFFDECRQKQSAYEDKWFRENRCPVFVARFRPRSQSSTVTLNAELKKWEFYRIFDTYSAFQEIYSFMSALAVPIEAIPEIDDVTMAEAKGFNKWSFRKEPTKRR